MDRRNFLKTTALASGGSVLIFSNVLGKSVRYSKLNMSASHWGSYYAVVKDGRVVGLKYPHFSQPSYLHKGVVDRIYVDRVEYPLVRKSFLKDGHKSDRSLRGKEEFVRVSWDRATELIASEIKRVQAKREDKNIFAGSYGWMSTGSLTHSNTTIKRLLNLTGGFIGHVEDYSTAAAQIINPYVTGSIEVYDQQTDWDLILKHADNIVFWGCDVYKTSQIDWVIADFTGVNAIKKLVHVSKRRRINKVFIDPKINDTQKYLKSKRVRDIKHIMPNPNTDVTIMFAIAHYLYTHKKYDSEFIETYTVGFEKFMQYILGKSEDKVVKNIKWASKISGVSSKEIANLARLLSHGKTMMMSGWAMQRADHGEQPSWMFILLSAMLGGIGKAGTGFGFSHHYSGGGSHNYHNPGLIGLSASAPLGKNGAKLKTTGKVKSSKSGTAWMDAPNGVNIPVSQVTDMLLNPGKVIDFNGKKVKYYPIDMVYWSGGNPFNHQMDTNKLYKAWNRAEVTIVHDIYMSSTAKMADIILPACSEFEKNDIDTVGSYSGSHIVAIKQAIKPVGESKDDYAICLEIAKKLGVEKEYSEGRSEMEWIEHFYNHSAKAAKSKGIHMPSFKTFWNKGYVAFPREKKLYIRHEEFIKDPEESPLGTESGKIQFYSPAIDKYNYKECKGHPVWLEPVEYLGNRKDKSYMHLISPHPKYRLHSQLDNSKVLRADYEMHGREPLFMNRADAHKRGIKHGDIVRVFNDRGSVLASASLSGYVKKEVVELQEGAWLDPLFDGDEFSCNHGNVNLLTVDKGSSELSQGNIANSALVKVEKYNGKISTVELFKKNS